MLDLLQQISKIPCVNGGERELSLFLKKYFITKGLSVQSFPGNHIFVKKDGTMPQTILFTPMDSPGFICLYKEDGVAYLSPTSRTLNDMKDFDSVINQSGKTFKIEESKYDKNAFCIKSKDVNIGDVLAITPNFDLKETEFAGRFSSKLACISVLIRLSEILTNPNIAFCFTAGFHSGSKAESNVMKRVGAKNAILLSPAETKENTNEPILALKDGKHFSSRILSGAFLASCKDNGISVQRVVFDKAISAAERTYAPHVKEILSLSLPCHQLYTANENNNSVDAMAEALKYFLNSNFS